MPHLSPDVQQRLFDLYRAQTRLVGTIDELSRSGTARSDRLSRYQLAMLPTEVAREYLQSAIHRLSGKRLMSRQVRQAQLFAKVAHIGTQLRFDRHVVLRATRTELIVQMPKKC